MTVKTEVHLVEQGLVIERTENVRDVLELSKAMHNEGLHGHKEMPLYANVPGVLIEDYCNRNGVTFADFMGDQAHVRRFLNDPAIAHFRVWPGRV